MRALSVLAVLLLVATAASGSEPDTYLGRTVADVIETYRAAGQPFAYSTHLVTESLLVEKEPAPGTAVEIVTQILAPHGLTIRTEAGVHLVVRVQADIVAPGGVLLIITSESGTALARATIGAEPTLPDYRQLKPGVLEYPAVTPGRYALVVDIVGHERARRVVEVLPGETTIVPIALDASRPVIEIINVSASRYEISREIAASRFALDQRTIQTMPDLGEDPLRIVQRLPGAAASGASAKTHLRGGEASEVGIMLNGQRLFDPFHIRDYQGVFSTVDSRAIDGVEVYTGGFPVQFGNRMSGMVLMETLAALKPRHTEIGLSVFNTSVLTAGHEADRNWLFSARRGNLDLVINPEFGSPSFYDVFAHYAQDLSPSTTVAINALYADDSVEVILESQPEELERVVSDTSNAQVWLRLDNRWSDALSSSTVVSAVAFDNRRRGALNDEEKIVASLSDARKITQFGIRQDFAYSGAGQHDLQWGLQARYSDAEYNYRNTAEYFGLQALYPDQPQAISRTLTATPQGAAYALYVSDRWTLSEQSVVEWGLRWDDQTYTSASSDAQLSPRLSYLHRFGEATELRASWGRYHQAQEINELQIEDGVVEFWPAQRADHLIVGLRHAFDERLALRVEAFHKDIADVRPRFENLFDPLGLIPEIQPDRVRLDPLSAESNGLELSVDFNGERWTWWATYVLSKAADRIGPREELRSWDQRHAFQGGLAWSDERWDFSLAASVHSGWPSTELALIDNGIDADGDIEWLAQPGPRNAGRHPTFGSLDMRLARKWKLKRGSLMAFFEVSNLTNRRNQCCLDFDVQENELTDELSLERGVDYWMPLLPAVGVLWEF